MPPLSEYDAMAAVADLAERPQSFQSYAKAKGFNRRAVGDAVRERAPELHERLVAEFGGTARDNKSSGTSFESAVRGMLKRRGYYVLRTYASKTAVDMLAVGIEKPNLMVQCKKDGKLYFSEWNLLYETATVHGCWPVLVRRGAEGKGFECYRLLAAKAQKGQRNDGMLLPFDPKFPDQDSLLAPPMAASAG